MTPQFHEGQEVEVLTYREEQIGIWRKAKIVAALECEECGTLWKVQFPDGTRAVFSVEHIRLPSLNFERLP